MSIDTTFRLSISMHYLTFPEIMEAECFNYSVLLVSNILVYFTMHWYDLTIVFLLI